MATLTADALANGADAPYWQGLIDGKPQLQRCGGCGTWHWPAVWRCGVCGGWNQVWEPIALKGEIYTWARTWHPFGGTEALPKPFVTLVVTIDGTGGRRLVGLLEGDEDGLAIGAPVTARIASTRFGDTDLPALRWTLARGR